MRIAVHALVFDKDRVLAIKGEGETLYRLPKAILREEEILADAARRGLKKEAGIEALSIQFVGIYDALDRIPSSREIAAVLLVRLWRPNPTVQTGVHWLERSQDGLFDFDHASILAEQRMFAPLSVKLPLVLTPETASA
jgi:ADP-ribose pyrophosphatase YjhB (NUDIX family)